MFSPLDHAEGAAQSRRKEMIDTACLDSTELSIWHQVESELHCLESTQDQHWWRRHTGKALAVLLYNAGYSTHIQYRDLRFFAEVVAPFLGVARDTPRCRGSVWSSFMTDDGNPVELSWDWGTGEKPPVIRYSIEPVGPQAGTSLDPSNSLAGPAFHKQLLKRLPEARLEWHNHFADFFISSPTIHPGDTIDPVDHNTNIFYAFDLSPSEITAKSYFFPKTRARIEHCSNLDVLSEAIRTAPLVTRDNLKAWSSFCDFASEPANQSLEHEMLAIDLIDPLDSRLKVYFRCRETTFDSVISIITLGGRMANPSLLRGLVDLARIWDLLFDSRVPLSQPLKQSDHRTAGILYNIEFRIGDAMPVAKVYLPVRHYSQSDKNVIRGLDKYFRYHGRGDAMEDYVRTMHTLFSKDSLQARAGVHTYIGCSVRPSGQLRVVSYFKSD